MFRSLRSALLGLLLAVQLAACGPAIASSGGAVTVAAAAGPGFSSGFGFNQHRKPAVSVGVSPLRLDVNLSASDWWAQGPPLVDTIGADYVNGTVSGNPIPDANRDASGNVISLPGGETSVWVTSQLPATTAQRQISWSCTGAAPCVSSMTLVNGTGVTYNLASSNLTYTPSNTLSATAGPPVARYVPTSTGDYPTNFTDRPVADPGGTTSALFNSVVSTDTSPSRILRFMDETKVNANNNPIHLIAGAGTAISSITFVGTTATVTTSSPHGLLGNGTGSASASITESGATPSTYNVTDAYVKVISPTQFQYTMAGTPTGNATVVGSYTVGDADFQFTNLHYPIAAGEPGTQFTEPIYTSANRNKNNADVHWHDGKPIETLAATAAGAGASAWYTAPPNADSTYYTAAAGVWATFAANNNRDVYVEVGNEPWNSGFKWYHQLRNEGNLRGTLGDALTACRLIATTNVGLSGLSAIDGITPLAGDRILVIGQSTAAQNGVYVAAAGAWSRAADTLAFRDIWLVNSGLTEANTSWFISTTGTITAGTTPLTIAQVNGAHRYVEKLIEVANPFITAFASAGAAAHLHVVAAWQNAGSSSIWSTMQAFLPSSDWAKITDLAVAPYYGTNQDSTGAMYLAGFTPAYTGATAPLKTAIISDMDGAITGAVNHQVAAQALGKRLIFYEGGSTLVLNDVTYKSTFERSSDAYDLELRYLQQLELRVASPQAGGLDLLSYNFTYPLGVDSFAWGQVEYLSQTLSKATTPKLWAHVDFSNGVRALVDQTSTFQIPVGAVNGTTVGTAVRSALGSTFALSNTSGGLFSINPSTLVVTVANAGLYTAGNSYPLSIDETLGTTHTTALSVQALSGTLWNASTSSTDYAFTNGSLTATRQTAGGNQLARANVTRTSGYFEVHIDAVGTSAQVGVTDASQPTADWIGDTTPSFGYLNSGAVFNNAGSVGGTFASYTTGDVIGVCIKGGFAYFSKNGVWQNGANPSAGTGGLAISGSLTNAIPAVSSGGTSAFTARFTSGFSGTIPTGVTAWN